MKPLVWMGDSREAVRRFSEAARHLAGHELNRVQHGLPPRDFKPMPTISAGVYEIRIRAELAYRVIYVAKFAEALYVLHAFVKKARKTPKADIDLAARRYRTLLNERMKR